MSASRDLAGVLPSIIQLIPPEESELLDDLAKLMNDLAYKAPELRKSPICWNEFVKILYKHIPKLETDWHTHINDIVTDRENESSRH
jgi:hypothetical protein